MQPPTLMPTPMTSAGSNPPASERSRAGGAPVKYGESELAAVLFEAVFEQGGSAQLHAAQIWCIL
jgi:hypothetical protein